MTQVICEFKAATIANAEALSSLAKVTFTETFGDLYAATDLQAHLEDACSQDFFAQALAKPECNAVIAYVDAAPVAYALWEPLSLHVEDAPKGSVQLQRLYVLKAFHGTQVAKELMAHVIDALKTAPAIYLGVWEHNLRAQRFYARYGFRHISEHSFLVGEQVDRDLIWVRYPNTEPV